MSNRAIIETIWALVLGLMAVGVVMVTSADANVGGDLGFTWESMFASLTMRGTTYEPFTRSRQESSDRSKG